VSTAREIYAFARTDRYGRVALAVVWLGAAIITGGLLPLAVELHRRPLVEVTR
jgi:hypothetical protein